MWPDHFSNPESSGHAVYPDFIVLYFASTAEYTRRASEIFPAGLTLWKLFEILEAKYPGIGERELQSCLVTVNRTYVPIGEDRRIEGGDEVALIPPVSAG